MAKDKEMTKTKKPRAKFYIPRESILAQLSIIFMLLSAIFRLIGVWGRWGDVFFRNTQILLPLCCNLLFVLCVFSLGKKGFFLSSIPVAMGVVFFIIKSLGFESWIHTVLCILLYILVLVLYCGTVCGFIRTKWLLPPLFGLPFIYHIFVEDLPMLNDTVNPMTFTYGMQELSVLCVMLSLFSIGLGLKKRQPFEDTELPKIKDPVVVSNKDSQEQPPEKAGEEP